MERLSTENGNGTAICPGRPAIVASRLGRLHSPIISWTCLVRGWTVLQWPVKKGDGQWDHFPPGAKRLPHIHSLVRLKPPPPSQKRRLSSHKRRTKGSHTTTHFEIPNNHNVIPLYFICHFCCFLAVIPIIQTYYWKFLALPNVIGYHLRTPCLIHHVHVGVGVGPRFS